MSDIATDQQGTNIVEAPDFPHGPGEVLMPRGLYIQRRIQAHYPLKRAIAKYIVETYVSDFDAVLLDAGSTAEFVAEEIFAKRKFLSVLTNNMGAYASFTRARISMGDKNTEDVLSAMGGVTGSLNGNELLITGGRYVDIYESLLGETTITSIQEFTPNVTIVGISGLVVQEGVFCHGSEESAVKKLMCTKPTDTRLIAADWSKIGKRDAHAFGTVDLFKLNTRKAVVVTCDPPRNAEPGALERFEQQIEMLERNNIKVERAPVTMSAEMRVVQ